MDIHEITRLEISRVVDIHIPIDFRRLIGRTTLGLSMSLAILDDFLDEDFRVGINEAFIVFFRNPSLDRHQLMAIQAGISEENNERLIDTDAEVLVEEIIEDGEGHRQAKGRTSYQAPEVDGNVYIDNPGDLKPGDFVNVHIIDGYAYDLIAEVKE